MSETLTIVGAGRHTYEVHEDWARPPAGMEVLAASVTVDAQDRVYCFNRNPEHPVVVFDRDGSFLTSWGAGLFAFPHVIRAARDNNLWIVDRDHAQMMLFDTSGKLLRTIGTKGFRSDTGVAPDYFKSDAFRSVTHGGGPFNLPTDIDVAPSGELFVTDGYGNARVHKFAADGTHLFSWGEPGTGPGEFNLPRDITLGPDGLVYVVDGGNFRIQVFDADGKFKSEFGNIGTPLTMCMTRGATQYLYVSHAGDEDGMDDAAIYKVGLDGKVLGKFGSAGKLPKEFGLANSIDCRNENELLVGEMTNWRVQKVTLK